MTNPRRPPSALQQTRKVKFIRAGSRLEHADQRIPILHWQLRNLLQCCPQNSDDLYYVTGNNVMKYNTKLKKATTVCHATSPPVCLNVSHNYLALGGQNGFAAVQQLTGNCCLKEYEVGDSINNSCHLAKVDGFDETRLYMCNNDRTIKVFSLPDMDPLGSIRHNTAVNFCAVDPDGKLIGAVGDNAFTVLYDARSHRQIARFREFTDSAFGVDFSADSLSLTTASQDGTVCVWDLRTRQVLWKTSSIQGETRGAARCVKFSPLCGVDLLMWTEHSSYVHIADMRTFEEQIIRVAPSGINVNISGCTFSNEADRIFISTEDNIVEYGINIQGRRTSSNGDII